MVISIPTPTNREVKDGLATLREKHNTTLDGLAPIFGIKNKYPHQTMGKWYFGNPDDLSKIPISKWYTLCYFINQ